MLDTPKPNVSPSVGLRSAKTLRGEYVLSSLLKPSDNDLLTEDTVLQTFGENLYEVKPLGHGQFLLKFDPDPGLEKLKEIGAKAAIKATVQPNLPYRNFRGR